ncbi:MAG: UDP-N-acetylglucosamine 1-carboxyvinyltransferase [Deltaproteobacteria bacterium]|nr:UDP-N-acetylglucosamine 1-carboxyvinyltransferase [Deltaproteobacteria bacterium]
MDSIVIEGGTVLEGAVPLGGSKNAALPVLISSLLTADKCSYDRVPALRDVRTTLRLLSRLGVTIERDVVADGRLELTADKVHEREAPYDLVKTMRASFLVLGPLLARFGEARVSTPGGCAIGSRPVDLHLQGLERMGAVISQDHGYVDARARKLRGAAIPLAFPSVGATENLMMAATLARGETVIRNAAREPEIAELAAVLTKMGARVSGAGGEVIRIEGVDELHGVSHEMSPDRIETGTFMVGAALTGGDVLIEDARAEDLEAFTAKLREAGARVEREAGGVRVTGNGRARGTDVATLPYPGFPTDLQAQMMVLMSVSDGASVITENIFENRFMHVQELNRMGARITLDGNRATVRGVAELSGAPVMATDLRASVSLVLAGLVARGVTEVSRVYHLDRGYEDIEGKLARLGADIRRVDRDD